MLGLPQADSRKGPQRVDQRRMEISRANSSQFGQELPVAAPK